MKRVKLARSFFNIGGVSKKSELISLPFNVQDTLEFTIGWIVSTFKTQATSIHSSNPKDQESKRFKKIALSAQAIDTKFLRCLSRIEQIEWMRKTISNDFNLLKIGLWGKFGSMGIIDFHVDIISTLDAIAILIATIKNHQYKSHFSNLYDHKNKLYKELKSDKNIRTILDNSKLFFSLVRDIRTGFIHKEHSITVFGGPKDGTYFQVYDQGLKSIHVILEKSLIWQNGVVDFGLYSALIISELIVLMHSINKWVAKVESVSIPKNIGYTTGSFKYMVSNMDRLLS